MAVLVLIDHEKGLLKQPSRSAIAAAAKLGEVHALVAGDEAAGAAAVAATKLPGVAKVLKVESAIYAHALAEPLAALLVTLAPGYTHLLGDAKGHPDITARLERRIAERDPAFHRHCDRVAAAPF